MDDARDGTSLCQGAEASRFVCGGVRGGLTEALHNDGKNNTHREDFEFRFHTMPFWTRIGLLNWLPLRTKENSRQGHKICCENSRKMSVILESTAFACARASCGCLDSSLALKQKIERTQ